MRHNKIYNNPFEREFVSYPYVWWDGAFTDEELKTLVTYCDGLQTDKGKVGIEKDTGIINTDTRNSEICFISPDTQNNWIFQRFNGILESLNDQFYGFDLQGYDHIQYGVYDSSEKQHYTWHMDSHLGPMQTPMLTRKLSLSFLLSEPGVDFEGGEFEINGGVESKPSVVEFKKNRAIAFPSWTIHRVKPVTKGVRKSLVIWVVGPKFK